MKSDKPSEHAREAREARAGGEPARPATGLRVVPGGKETTPLPVDEAVELKQALRERVARIQRKPFAWPGDTDTEAARRGRTSSGASKHALLAEGLEDLGLPCAPLLVTGRLVPSFLEHDPEFEDGVNLLEVHDCLVVLTPWAGPLRVDVTWDPPLIAYGLPGTMDWDGASDMRLAVEGAGPGWTVPRRQLRSAKEALRKRLYAKGEQSVRDRILTALSRRVAGWRI